MRAPHGSEGDESGQASVELVALLPLLAALGVLLWQVALAGQAVWLSGAAARGAARAAAVGGDPRTAARAVLPPRLDRGLRVRVAGDGAVAVTLRVPFVLGGGALTTVRARARMESQR